jgi:lysophospholipase L1-like esterase
MKMIRAALAVILFAGLALAQIKTGGNVTVPASGAPLSLSLTAVTPAGTCALGQPNQFNYLTGHTWACTGAPGAQVLTDITAQRSGNRVCSLGDSLSGLNATDTRWAPTFLTYAVLVSKGQMQFVHNGGISGQTSDQILARIVEVTGAACDKVYVEAGSNDIAAGSTAAVVEANLTQMYAQILAAGELPIATTIPPRGTFYAQVNTLNAWIRRTALKLEIPLFDMYAPVTDATTGGYKTGYSGDAIHPQGVAVRLVGTQAFADVQSVLPAAHTLLPASNSDPTNIVTNALMITSSGGVPAGWTTSSPAAHTAFSVSTDTNLAGNAFVMTKTVAGTSDNDSASFTLVNNAAVIPGHTYAFTGRIVTSGNETGNLILQVSLDTYTSGFATNPLSIYPVYAYNPGVDIPAGQWYMEFVMPANVTIFDVSVALGNGTGVVKVGQIGLYDLTALGLSN